MAPKAIIKDNKKQLVAELATRLTEAKSVVFVDYSGMGVKTQEELKSKLREVGGVMLVAKNTLVNKALQEIGLPSESEAILRGQTAMVLSGEDAVASIQILGKFAKDNEIPKIKAGVVEGIYLDQNGIIRISTLPSKAELQAKVVGAVSAPMYGIVGVLNTNMQKLVYILNSYKETK